MAGERLNVYAQCAVKDKSAVTKSFWYGKLLQNARHASDEGRQGTEMERFGDQLQLAESTLQIHATSLSPYVYDILTQSVTESDAVVSELTFVLDDGTLLWSNISEFITDTTLSSSHDFYNGSMKVGIIAKSIFARMNDKQKANIFVLAKESFNWTQFPEVFAHSVQLVSVDHTCANILSCLLSCAALERALDCLDALKVYLSASGADQSPSLLRDLLETSELLSIFGPTAVWLLRCLMGHPSGLNLRNILWHGFVAPTELPVEYAHLLPVLVANLGRLLESRKSENPYPCTTLGRSGFTLHHRPCVALYKEHFAVFPDIIVEDLDTVKDLFSHSYFILPSMLPIWLEALRAFQEKRAGDCIVLMLPSLEHSLRRVFACINNVSEWAMTAEATVLYTTFDEILSKLLPDGSPNLLKEEIGIPKLEMLLDLLVHPEGPRLRAKVSHGEVDFSNIPINVAGHLLCIAVVFCAQYTLKTELNETPLVSSCLAVEKKYHSCFHPISLLKAEILQLIHHLQEWNQIPLDADNHVIRASDDVIDKFQAALHYSAIDSDCRCSSSLELLESMMLGSPLDPLLGVVSDIWQRPLGSLYVGKPELELIGLARAITDHTKEAVCQIKHTATERHAQLTRRELHKRQRANYEHLLSSLAVYHQAVVLVVVIVCTCASKLSLKTGLGTTYTKFLKKVLQLSENFHSQTSHVKNRWREAEILCYTLFALVSNTTLSRSHEMN